MAINALIKRFFSGSTPIILVFMLLLNSLYMMSGATHNSATFGQLYSLLLGINILAIFLFLVLIGKSLWLLVQQYRQQTTGSRLTAKLVVMFVILSVTPVTIVFYFSQDFIKRGIDSWFDVRIENALDDALKLSQAALDQRMRERLQRTRQVAQQLETTDNNLVALKLNDLRNELGAQELTLFSRNGQIIASNSTETSRLVPVHLDDITLHLLHQRAYKVGLIPVKDAGLHIRTAVAVPGTGIIGEGRILQALFPVAKHMNDLANSVQSAFGQYREITYLRTPLKYNFILTLSLVLLLSILTAIWAAFYAARRMTAPIYELVEGTRAIAAGNYDKRLPLPGNDELGFLVSSFNDMTWKIAQAREDARDSQLQLQTQHTYLETVLANLSSGVLTLDSEFNLRTCNKTASQILGLDVDTFLQKPLKTLAKKNPGLQVFVDTVSNRNNDHESSWQAEISLLGPAGHKALICRGSILPDSDDRPDGLVIVFDDITALLQAQRNAAWGEVARRLAHEIKNPLTPIQLSAERLRHKYLHTMSAKDADVLDRATHTIVQQVETMKELVKAFSEYARMPTLELEALSLNRLIEEVLELYRGPGSQLHFELELDPSIPPVEADTGRLRQLLHNLLKNAQEAMHASADSSIKIHTRCGEEQAGQFVELRLSDTGPGIPEKMFEHLFDPYVTSKPKGSGLGLAIVKKIVEEHGGVLWAENNKGVGASIVIRLPVAHLTTNSADPDSSEHHEPQNHASA
ncbi:Nitrogen regulation protein NtrY [hydrothermal vent metagenome]|uniref:histidine kinase n=1 Tax=hydrothermal vent metagenome TaxID=652676 RepID=A0A3B1APW3_9ZZZZ